jgi:hypothetical protein
MKKQPKFCPNCGSIQTRTRTSELYEGIEYQIFCVDCLLCGDWSDSLNKAISNWNKIE